jgi:virginiamycin B lyase
VVCVLVVLPAAAARAAGPATSAFSVQVSNFTDPGIVFPRGITGAPDGTLWFTNDRGDSIGRITTGGVISMYKSPVSLGNPSQILPGLDGTMWFIIQNGPGGVTIGRIGMDGSFLGGYGPQPAGAYASGIAPAPDNAMWVTTSKGIVRVDANGNGTTYTDPSLTNSAGGIALGPDGALWFANPGGNSIGRINTSGVFSNYTDPSIKNPQQITTGPDGALWFTNFTGNSIGRITTSGSITNFTDPSISGPAGIVTGKDGALWFTNSIGNSIGRITTSGVVTSYTDPTINRPIALTVGPDGALWFANENGNSIGRLQVIPATTPQGPIVIPTKQTPLKKPPPPPKAAPPKYGLIKKVQTTPTKDSLQVVFVFSKEPLSTAKIRAAWYYNNKSIGVAPKSRGYTISTRLKSGSALPAGYWRCALEIKLESDSWHTIKEARILLH